MEGQGEDETPSHSQDETSSGSPAHADKIEELNITSIQATDVALGLRRIPAGFYVTVYHNGLEWRTENKPSSTKSDIVEWTEPIPIPSDMLATVRFEVYASFELQPMLGVGEQLRKLTVPVERLEDRGTRAVPFVFFQKDGDVVSPCSSITVSVERRKRQNSDSPTSRDLDPRDSTTESRGGLVDATNQGHGALSRYRKGGIKRDLEHSIKAFERALNICPMVHPCRAVAESNLAMAKFIRCQSEDMDTLHPLTLYRNALGARPVGHLDRPSTLVQLAAVHFARFEKSRDRAEGAKAERLLDEAIQLSPADSHAHQGAKFMVRLHAARRVGYIQPNDRSSVEQGLTAPLADDDLASLAMRLWKRFERSGNLVDLEQVIPVWKELTRSTPVRDKRYCARLGMLGTALLCRFRHLGELRDLEDAIPVLRDAVDLAPDGDPGKHGCVNSLGLSLITRFEHFGKLRDLEDAIPLFRQAVHLVPIGHPDRPGCLNNLGNSSITRFERFGELRDLEDGISVFRNAVDIIPHNHPEKPNCLNNLGVSFRARFLYLGELRDLEDAISLFRYAIDLTPRSHPGRPTHLNNLGLAFITRYERLRELKDIEESIPVLRDAVDLTPHRHLDKPARLSNLGLSLQTRFNHLGELSDLEDAISVFRNAIDLTPHSRPERLSTLNNLGLSLIIRFMHLRELKDLEESISVLRDVVVLTPQGHPDKPNRLNNLGRCFSDRFRFRGKLNDLEVAIALYSRAASTPFGPIEVRFRASRNWILCARHIHHRSLFHAYSVAIDLLPHLAWIGFSLSHRYYQLTQGADLVREAAAAALDAGLPETAVEWLERGRSVVWGELFQLRSSYDELSSAHPDHARRLRELSVALEHASAIRDQSLSALSERMQSTVDPADRHRALAMERDELLREIRRLPGFEGFLRHRQFSQLRASAHAGPVVILNAAESRCDALIVLSNVDHVIHVPLPRFTFKRSVGLQNMLEKLLGHARTVPVDERTGQSAMVGGVSWGSLLSVLWKDVVKHVLDALAFSSPGELSRIFWCPTGPFTFLPIHAAGLYDTRSLRPGHQVFDFVISSYVPTLSILTRSHNPDSTISDDLRLLLVRQPPSDGLSRLPGVVTELTHIREIVRSSSARTTLLETSVGTVEEVLETMKMADWVHFACHGIQDGVDSGLCLADKRRLRVRDIITLSRPTGGLAFLSACQTAMGDERLSDEAIHVAAGMLFAGYGGVVGTMWSISDKLAPDVARDVYEELLRGCSTPDYRKAARALHEAIGRVRDDEKAPFVTWLPFIHMGL